MSLQNINSLLYRFFVEGNEKLPPDFERLLFRLITLPNGTTKNTSAGRLDDLNALMLPFLKNITSPSIKDVAVSSGISTVEWIQYLKKNNVKPYIKATDLFAKAFLVIKSDSIAILCDQDLNPVLLEIRNTMFRTSFPKGSTRYFWGKLLSGAVKRFWLQIKPGKENSFRDNTYPAVIPVELFTSALKNTSDIDFAEEDILLPPFENEINKYDVIRAANILNKVYFSNDGLEMILSNLASQLKTGGILAVCKTDDAGKNHAGIFTKKDNGFILLQNMNGGTEIENIVHRFSISK